MDLRRDVEVRIGARLADAVLDPGAGVAGAAEHAQHRAAVVAAPGQRVRRHRVRPEPAVGVDRGRAEHRHRAAMLEQAGEPGRARVGEHVHRVARAAARRGLVATEGVGAARQVVQRLVQVPAARHHVRERRPADEAGVVAGAAQRLGHAVAEGDHPVGGRERIARLEHRLDLARPELDLERGERQPQALGGALDDAQRLVAAIGPAFGEQVVAGMDHGHRRRLARPGGALRVQRRGIAQRIGEAIDVELDLEAAGQAEAFPGEAIQRLTQDEAGVDRHRRRVVEPGLGAHPAGAGRPRQDDEAGGIGQQHQVVGEAEAGQARGRARLEHAVRGAVGGVLEKDGADQADAVGERPRHRRGGEGLAAQDAVAVAPADAHEVDALAAEPPQHRLRRRGTRRIGRAACFGEAHRRSGLKPTSPRARASVATPARRAPARLAAAARLQCASQPSAGAMQSIVSGPWKRGRLGGARRRHRRPAAAAHRLDRLQQRAPVGHDHLVGGAEMLAGPVLDRAHALHRPLVVQVDVFLAHAEVGAACVAPPDRSPSGCAGPSAARSPAARRRPGAGRASSPCRAGPRSW